MYHDSYMWFFEGIILLLIYEFGNIWSNKIIYIYIYIYVLMYYHFSICNTYNLTFYAIGKLK